jgi:hypothetical protein
MLRPAMHQTPLAVDFCAVSGSAYTMWNIGASAQYRPFSDAEKTPDKEAGLQPGHECMNTKEGFSRTGAWLLGLSF